MTALRLLLPVLLVLLSSTPGAAAQWLPGLGVPQLLPWSVPGDGGPPLPGTVTPHVSVGAVPTFRHTVGAIAPSVVNVSTTREIRAHALMGPWHGTPFGPLFGPADPRRTFQQRSLGSGVIVSADGHVLTNHHVVDGASEILLTLSDGRGLEARVVGSDAETDVAVLVVDDLPDDVVPATFAPEGSLAVGDWVLAVGNPMGFGHTITSGIVSALQRSTVGVARYEDFIQTDAAINPGNSGGPLVDLHGRVVGLNTAIASRSGGSQGIGFAIPAPMVRRVMDDLLEKGRVDRGWLGVLIQDLTPELAESFDFEGPGGVLVAQVMDDGPAQQAGLQVGDIVLRLGERAVSSSRELATAIATRDPDTEVDVEVFRDDERHVLTVTIGKAEAGAAQGERLLHGLGVTVVPVTPELRERFRRDVEAGAWIESVSPGSPAAALGLRPGDVILGVGNVRVDGPEGLAEALARFEDGDKVRLLVDTDGRQRFLLLQL